MNYNEYLRNGFASILQESVDPEKKDTSKEKDLLKEFRKGLGDEITVEDLRKRYIDWAKSQPYELSYLVSNDLNITYPGFVKVFNIPGSDASKMTRNNVSLAGYLILKYVLNEDPKTLEEVKEWLVNNNIGFNKRAPGFLQAQTAKALEGKNKAEEEKPGDSDTPRDLVDGIKTTIQTLAEENPEEKSRFDVVIEHISSLTTAKEIFEKILDLYEQDSGNDLRQDALVCSKILVKVWKDFGNQLVAEGVKKDDILSNILIADEALKLITENNDKLKADTENITSEDYAYLSSLVEDKGNSKTVNGYSYDYYRNKYSDKNDIAYYKFVVVDINANSDTANIANKISEAMDKQKKLLEDKKNFDEAKESGVIKDENGKTIPIAEYAKNLRDRIKEVQAESAKANQDLMTALTTTYGIKLSKGTDFEKLRKFLLSLSDLEEKELDLDIQELSDVEGLKETLMGLETTGDIFKNDSQSNPLMYSDEELWARGMGAYIQAATAAKRALYKAKKQGYGIPSADKVLAACSTLGIIGTALCIIPGVGQLAIAPALLFSAKLLTTVPGAILGTKNAIAQWKRGNKFAALGCAAGAVIAATGAFSTLKGFSTATASGVSPKDAFLRMFQAIAPKGIDVGDTTVSPEEASTIMADQRQALINGGMSEEQADKVIESQLNNGVKTGIDDYKSDQASTETAKNNFGASNIGEAPEDTSSSNGPLNPNGVEPTGNTVENTHAAVANAQPGDMITRDDGTKVILSQGDIEYEKNFIAGNADSASETASPTVAEQTSSTDSTQNDLDSSQATEEELGKREGDLEGKANPTGSPTEISEEGAAASQVDPELLLKQGNTDELFRGFNTEQMPSESEMEAFATVDPETNEKSYDIPQNELSYFEREYLKNLGATGSSTEYVDADGNPQLNADGSPRYLSAIHATPEQVNAAREAQSIIGRTFDAESPNRITNITELQNALQDAAKQNGATLTGNCKTIIDPMMDGFNGENANTFTGMDTQSNRTILQSLQKLAGNSDWGTDRVGAEFNADNFKLRSPYINNGS